MKQLLWSRVGIDQNNDEYMDETDDGTEENGLSLLKDELHLVQ